MGKSKKHDPEPEKIIRKLGDNLNIEITEAEKRYRNKNGPDDLSQVDKEKLKCTVCARSLTDLLKKGNEPYVHMLLNVLMCRDCSAFYGDGYFSVDEDGDDKYCRWCGQGGTLYLCSSCTCAFCKKCIKQNLNRQDVKDMESDDWKCLICKPNPLFECRTLCWFLQENYKKKEEEDNDISEKGKKNHNQKNEERRGSKRKSVDPLEVRSKRKKSTDSLKDTSDVQRKSNDSSVPDRQRRIRSLKEVEKPDEEKMKTSSRSGKSSRRINSKLENELTSLSNNASKKSSKIEEVVISDDNDEDIPESSPKKSKKQNSKKDLPKKATSSSDSIDKRPKRSLPKRELKSPETPKTPKKADKTSKSSSGKKKSAKTSDKAEASAVKRSQRFTKKISSYEEESDGENKESDSGSQLISLDDDNSCSESEKKMKTSRRKSSLDDDNSSIESESKRKTSRRKSTPKSKSTLNKLTLTLPKDAANSVIEGSGIINSAVNDILELTVLIANRCERLCSRSVQSVDEVVAVFKKMKHLTGGVHSNLELIEKGLDTKFNVWKGVNAPDIPIPEESLETEIKLLKKDDLKVSTSPNKVKEEEEIKTSSSDLTKEEQEEELNDSLKEKKEEEIDTSSIKEKEEGIDSSCEKDLTNDEEMDKNLKNDEKMDEDLKNEEEMDENLKNDEEMDENVMNDEEMDENVMNVEETDGNLKNDEEMEVEESEVKTDDDQKENIDNIKLNETNESTMDINKENQNNVLKPDAKETVTVDTDDVSNSDMDKGEQLSQEENLKNKESLENKDTVDEIKSDASEENVDSSHSTGNDESVDKLVPNDDSSRTRCETINDNPESCKKKSEINNVVSEKTENGKIESIESDKLEKNEDREEEIIGKEDDYVKEDANNCILEGDANSDILDDNNTILSSPDKLNEKHENGLPSTNLENLSDRSIAHEKLYLEKKEKELDQEEEGEIQSKQHLNEGSSEVKPTEEKPQDSPAKQTQESNESTGKSAEREDVKYDDKEKKKDCNSSGSRHTEKRDEYNPSRTDDKLSPGSHHQSDRDSSRSSGDRDRHRWSGGWDNRDRGHNWNRDQYSQERGRSGGRGGSWNRYDDRRPNRGGWGWKR